MAKATAPAMPKEEPRAHVSWPKDGFKVTGQLGVMQADKKVRVVIEGTVKGYSMAEYGCSLDMKPTAMRVESLEGAKGDKSMVEQVMEMKPAKKGG